MKQQAPELDSTETMSNDLRLEALRSIYDELGGQPGSKKSRLYETCLKMIERGFWNPGDRLPTDIVLTENLPVSLGTIQAVFRRLKDENLIIRNKRQGSFLASAEKINRDYWFFAFLDDDGEMIMAVTDEGLTVDVVEALGPWSDFLGKWPQYFRITRTINVHDEFRIHSEFYLASPRFRPILWIPPEELSHTSIKNVLQVRFGTPTLRAEWRMRFAALDLEQPERLRAEPGTPGVWFDVNGYTLRDEPLFFHKFLVPRNTREMKIAT